MENITRCPYCKGSVEVIKLIRKPGEEFQPYRIQCLKCKACVARGKKFPNETEEQGEQRIKEYNAEMKRIFSQNRT